MEMRFQLQFLFICLILPHALAQGGIPTINLQQNERYVLKLSDYLNFTASTIEYEGIPAEDILPLYKTFGNYDSTQDLNAISQFIASYEDGVNSKTLLGLSLSYDVQSRTDIVQITLTQLLINQNTPSYSELASHTFSPGLSLPVSVVGTMYSSTNGFVTLTGKGVSTSYHFYYTQTSGIKFDPMTTPLDLTYSASLMNIQQNSVYIIQYDNDSQISLYLYSNGANTFQLLDQQITDRPSQGTTVGSYLFTFSTIDNSLKCFFVDQEKQKLVVNLFRIPNPQQLFYYVINTQSFREYLIVNLRSISQKGDYIVKLKVNRQVPGQFIEVADIISLPQSFYSSFYFIDDNIFITDQGGVINMVDVKKKDTIYTINESATFGITDSLFVQDYFIWTFETSDDSGNVIYQYLPIQFKNPSVILQGNSNLALSFTISESNNLYKQTLKINTNVTNELITSVSPLTAIQNIVTSLSDQTYYVPIEKYVIGSNLNPTLDTSVYLFIKNLQFNKIVKLKSNLVLDPFQIQNVYQTDGFFSSIVVTVGDNNQYQITAANPAIGDYGAGILSFYPSSNKPTSTIGQIDNYGTYVLQSDIATKSYTINVPFIVQNTLQYQTVSQSCGQPNFTFASDPTQGVLFVLCGEQLTQITYQYSTNQQLYQQQSIALQIDASSYKQLICIKGNLIMYSNTQIYAYNYISNGFASNVIKIPQLGQQKLVFFSSSFIISYTDQKNLLSIAMYSYGDFASTDPILIRYLLQGQSSQQNLSLIPKRNALEYLFVSTGTQNQYSIFRINKGFSQNQLYTTIQILQDSKNTPIINSNYYCNFSEQVSCWQILEEASISYQQNLSQADFNSNLKFMSFPNLAFGDKIQKFNLFVLRDASTQYGVINQQASSLQQLRTALQDIGSNSKNTILYFNDTQVFNACIQGWSVQNGQATMINRISSNIIQQSSVSIFTILYTLQVFVYTDSIVFGKQLLVLESKFQGCVVLDDSASLKTSTEDSSVTIDVYIICEVTIYSYNLKAQLTTQNIVSSLSVVSISQNPVNSLSIVLSKFKRLIGQQGSNQLWIFNPQQVNDCYVLTKPADSSSKFGLSYQNLDWTTVLSYNVINSLNLRLSFFQNGQINVESTINGQLSYSIVRIQDLLLENVYYSESVNDYISTIQQYSDTQFRIQFANTLIYDITFGIKNNNLIINKASPYYYQDAFSTLVYGISGSTYTLLLGTKVSTQYLALYTNAESNQGYYLIQSTSSTVSQIDNDLSVTNAVIINDSQFTLYLSNGQQLTVSIAKSMGINFEMSQSYYKSNTVTIYPKPLDSQQYWVQLSGSSVNPKSSSTKLSWSLILSLVIAFLV